MRNDTKKNIIIIPLPPLPPSFPRQDLVDEYIQLLAGRDRYKCKMNIENKSTPQDDHQGICPTCNQEYYICAHCHKCFECCDFSDDCLEMIFTCKNKTSSIKTHCHERTERKFICHDCLNCTGCCLCYWDMG